MIAAYFAEIEQTIQSFPNILRSVLTKKQYNARQGCISGSVSFDNGCRLEFMELKDCNRAAKVKYRYQYMDERNTCLFRYDNAPHHPELATFPHHKHNGDEITPSLEPTSCWRLPHAAVKALRIEQFQRRETLCLCIAEP